MKQARPGAERFHVPFDNNYLPQHGPKLTEARDQTLNPVFRPCATLFRIALKL
jgi:hypothetical protein